MSEYKNQIGRLRTINNCLRSRGKKYWSKKELIEKIAERTDLSVSERTLDGDIYCLRYDTQLNFNAPIKYSKKEDGYYYTDPDYSIDNLPFNEKDIEVLEFATSTLRQYRSVKLFNEFTGTVDKLIALVNHLRHTSHETHLDFVDFEKAPFSKGTEYLDILVEAIKNKKVVKLVYQKFDDDQTKAHFISPCLLKEYRNRWYLIGLHHGKQAIATFGLDRIAEAHILNDQSFCNLEGFSSDTYFKNTLGISFSESTPEEIVLSFSTRQGKYIKTQHLHSTQEILVDNEQEFRIKLTLVPNYELTSTILSYGQDVKVISPNSLRERIAKEISDLYHYYQQFGTTVSDSKNSL